MLGNLNQTTLGEIQTGVELSSSFTKRHLSDL
jgi:hypothetical protein